MNKEKYVRSACGIDCSACVYMKDNGCAGCIELQGKPFWTQNSGCSCEVAECVKKHGIMFCGECADMPCELLKRFSYAEKEGDNGARIENCRIWKRELVKEARQGHDSVSVCGHHCDYCFLGQWCGGCRSDYNGCSYASVCPGGKCPQVVCAGEKGLDGCYECEQLETCRKGYYSKEESGEYTAKATALFIRKYGKECYGETLARAVRAGEKYAASFDQTGSVEAALALLEKYISK